MGRRRLPAGSGRVLSRRPFGIAGCGAARWGWGASRQSEPCRRLEEVRGKGAAEGRAAGGGWGWGIGSSSVARRVRMRGLQRRERVRGGAAPCSRQLLLPRRAEEAAEAFGGRLATRRLGCLLGSFGCLQGPV